MSCRSRRHVLSGVAALLVGWSGCTDVDTVNSSTPTLTEREFPHGVSTPLTRQARHPEGDPAVRSSVETPTRGWSSTEWVVTSPRERDALVFSPDVTGVGGVKEFVDETDLSEQTLLVHQYSIEACRTRQLEQLQWREAAAGPERTAIHLEYATTERGGNCQREAHPSVEATFALIPNRVAQIGRFSSAVS